MGDQRVPAGLDRAVDGTGRQAIDEGDRRDLVELLTRQTPAEPAGDDRIGAAFLRRTVDRAVAAILAAGWRPPAPTLTTEADLAVCRPGTAVTDRDGHPRVLSEAGQRCEPLPTGVYPDELVQWAPLTRHLDGLRPRADP
jgi:hypothetical protein